MSFLNTLGLAAAAAVLLAFGAGARPVSAQAPVTGDALVDASFSEVSNLIPALVSDVPSANVSTLIYRGLVKYGKDFNLVPDLAESWEIGEDQRVVTFRLRPGVVWEDGTPFTAEDCVFTWKLMSDPLTPTAYGENFVQIESAEAVDPLTFRVVYKRVMAAAVDNWAFSIMPKHLLEGQDLDSSPLARKPVGNGPFRLKEWLVGQRVTLEANPDYWEGRPYLDRLITKLIPDTATQWMELATGALDMMSLEPDRWLQAKGNPSVAAAYDLHRTSAFLYTYLGFNLHDPRLADVRVRRAIAFAIDKDEVVDGVLMGFGLPSNGPFRPDMWMCNQNVKPYPFDPQQAKRLLAEAGWTDSDGDGVVEKDGQKFVLTIMTNQGNRLREQTGLVIQARLKDVGIDVKLRIVEWAAFLKENLDKKDFEAIIMGWTIPLEPDLYEVFNSTKTKPGELNFIGYANAEVDELIDQSRFTLDRAVRKAAYDRIQEIFYEEVPYVFLFIPDSLTALSKRFVGPEPAPIGLSYNLNLWHVPKNRQLYVQ
jgi:peptide/nickel transport system substrate-binding protein